MIHNDAFNDELRGDKPPLLGVERAALCSALTSVNDVMHFASDLFVHAPHSALNFTTSAILHKTIKTTSTHRDKVSKYDLTFYSYLPAPLPGVLEQSEPRPHPAPRLLHFRRIPAITLQ